MRYQESNERRRLSGQLTQRSSQTGLSSVGTALFGLPFVVAGMGIGLIGLKVLPVDPKTVHAPYWVLTAFGSCFLAAGLLLWGMAIRQFRANRRRAALGRSGPEAIALTDYDWDRRGFQPSRAKQLFKTLGFAVGLSVFLSMFNWWAFGMNGPLMVKIIVSIFDLALLALWFQFFLTLARALRFSASRIDFARFPYATNDTILIRWPAPRGMGKPHKGTFTLRCVQEWWERTGSGKNRSTTLIQEELCSGTWELDPKDELPPGKIREFSFPPFPGAQPTSLSSPPAFYWEFEVKLEMSGPDFVESYLVPVYQ